MHGALVGFSERRTEAESTEGRAIDFLTSPIEDVLCGESSALSTVERQPKTRRSGLVCEQRWTRRILI